MFSSAPLEKSRDNIFNLFRLALAVGVVFSHSFGAVGQCDPLHDVFHTVSFAEVAVDCFFILSGFLITISWENASSVPKYLTNRVLRIYPGFLLAFFVTVFIVGPLGAASALGFFHGLSPVALFMDAISLRSPATPPSFPNSPDQLINRAMWTIHIEFICYVMVLGLGVSRILRRRRLLVLLYIVMLAGFTVFRALPQNAATSDAVYGGMGVSLLRFVPMFLAGVVMYKTSWHRIRPAWLIAAATAILAAGLCNRFTAEPAIATAGSYLMLVAGTAKSAPAPLRHIPDLSYGIYLYGSPGLKLSSLVPDLTLPAERFAFALVFAFGMALFSWHVVESPALRFKTTKFMMGVRRFAAAK